jgi:hypothetical protein
MAGSDPWGATFIEERRIWGRAYLSKHAHSYFQNHAQKMLFKIDTFLNCNFD